ncbi:protein phosphatase regulator GIP4 NDAI_0H02610 [Naumovozyma dairenensis CBS 421]|uniref:GLC7-interacting protein 4 n=1 Tax=Naumovozyma dairenensis (strain ATCC 10597 / BCRC 20456 / CBS 421 / NBRC 0211 / NRRL Y-12639) TaxID=1071378 RepID=G0WF74_NAUDC|nr:hypothetical protein NDAI_0H02610 [Naumovozyma dairenensis CBS 421]CCD26435.1 hypothetical protein NDAI_0H02610 [Naumovozyma dairenensis CBS 421]
MSSIDIKLIQYKSVLYILNDATKNLNTLADSLKAPQRKISTNNNNNKIIPLINYTLSLLDGPIFNIHPILRKRYNLLCQFKLCKLTQLDPPISNDLIDLDMSSPPRCLETITELQGKLYDEELQWRLLTCLKQLIINTTMIYNKNLKQLQLERNSPIYLQQFRSGFKKFDILQIEDIVQPIEMSLILDFAVLIRDHMTDTSLKSMEKLQWQLLQKFLSFMNEEIIINMKLFVKKLRNFSKTQDFKGLAPASMSHVLIRPIQESIVYRVYSFLLRCLCLSQTSINLIRQIFSPNKEQFNSIRWKLAMENTYCYELTLNKLYAIESGSGSGIIQSLKLLIDNINSYARLPLEDLHRPTPEFIMELYQSHIINGFQTFRDILKIMNNWLTMWKFARNNSIGVSKLKDLDQVGLDKMLNERKVVDRLKYLENQSKLKEKKKNTMLQSSRTSTFSSVSSSLSTSPNPMSPLKLSRTTSIENAAGKKIRNVKKEIANNIRSKTNSPTISRRGSITPRSGISANLDEKKSTKNTSNRSVLSNGRRPRSSSLQSSFNQNKTTRASSKLSNELLPPSQQDEQQKRSNSLEPSATINQRIVQSAVKHSMNQQKLVLPIPYIQSNETTTTTSSSSLSAQSYSTASSKLSSPQPLPTPLSTSSHKDRLTNNNTVLQEVETRNNHYINDDLIAIETLDLNNNYSNNNIIIKKVRFVGVPPITKEENHKPTRQGWYKKPPVLYYPPIPSVKPTMTTTKYSLRKNIRQEEGFAFRTSLREQRKHGNDENGILQSSGNEKGKENMGHRLASKLRDKLR